MSLAALLQQVVGVLEAARVPYMLTGSLAAAYYATPRATQDIDIVVAPEEAGLRRAVEGLSAAGYYVDLGAPLEALRSNGQFNAVDPDTGWKVDLIVRRERDVTSCGVRPATACVPAGCRSLLGQLGRPSSREDGMGEAGRLTASAK